MAVAPALAPRRALAGRRWFIRASWVVLAAVLAVGLVLGTTGAPRSHTPAQRAAQLANEVRCPSCGTLSAGQENTPAALAIRRFISQQVAAGRSDQAILDALVASYGPSILLRPPASGLDALVWVVPVAGIGAAVLGLGLFLITRRRVHEVAPTASQEDRELVQEALAGVAGPDPDVGHSRSK